MRLPRRNRSWHRRLPKHSVATNTKRPRSVDFLTGNCLIVEGARLLDREQPVDFPGTTRSLQVVVDPVRKR